MKNLRAVAAEALAPILRHSGSLASSLPLALEQVAPRDGALLQELCYGTARWQPQLDLIAAQLLQKPFRAKDADIHALVLLGLYQMRNTRIPPHAALNETVAAARALKKTWAAGLLNGVLRRYQRDAESLEAKAAANPVFQHSHPTWLAEMITQQWPNQAAAIFDANNQKAPLTLRVNTLRTRRDDYLVKLQDADINATSCAYSSVGIQVSSPIDVTQLPGFTDGDVSVQDEAAQLAAGLLQLAQGQRVLDACAAPGGKTAHLLETEPTLAEVVAVDKSEQRLASVAETLDRLQLAATLVAADAAVLDSWWDGNPFDRILLDAPCSASGVIRRHPDIKLLRRADDVAKLAAVQLELLQKLWQTLAPGGLMLYATCSVLQQENELQIADFLASQPDASEIGLDAAWGEARQHGRQLFPTADGHDGFYYALLQKRHQDAKR